VLYDILSAGAQSYLSLAREVMDRTTRGHGDGIPAGAGTGGNRVEA
jgi:hypothetical protein